MYAGVIVIMMALSAIKYAYKKYLSYRTARLDGNVTPLK